MKCAKCGYQPPKGRPKKLDDSKVADLRARGMSLAEIAGELGASRSGVQAAIKRASGSGRPRRTP